MKPSPAESTQIALFTGDEPTNTFKKAVQIVHSKPSEPLSLLQGKLSNCWLKNAYESEPDEDGWWCIEYVKMANEVGFDSNNRDHLRNSALDLMKIIFEYDVLSKNNHRTLWKASVLFPSIEIREGSIRYQISTQLQARVLDPDMYALVDLNVLRRFQRSSSIPIYEHCVRFVNLGKTPEVELTTFRDIVLGSKSGSGSYKEYKYFKQKVLLPSITEINHFSEILIELIEGFAGRRVNSIQFLVKRKKSKILPSELSPELAKIGESMSLLGMPVASVKKNIKKHSINEMLAAIEYTKKRQADKRSTLENPAAYLQSALDNKWGIIEETPAVEPKPTSVHKSPQTGKKQLKEAFQVHQISEAEKHFSKLNGPEQEPLVKRYNDQQALQSLRFNSKRRAKGAQTAFFQWLAIQTWGIPTAEQLLEFAENLMNKPQNV